MIQPIRWDALSSLFVVAACLSLPQPALAQSGLLAQSFAARGFVVDAAIFAALVGGAVFAVCRSSKRV